jgi:hypothetical protein
VDIFFLINLKASLEFSILPGKTKWRIIIPF